MGHGEHFSRQAAAWIGPYESSLAVGTSRRLPILSLPHQTTVEEVDVRAKVRDHRIWRSRRVRPD